MVSLAALTAGAQAQGGPNSDNTQEPAPIVRGYAGDTGGANAGASGQMAPARRTTSSQPIAGVIVRTGAGAQMQTVSADAKGTELRITQGVANVSVHHPGKDARILVDLPGGQAALLKDGLYTFNADTNTVRVLKGEADAYSGSAVDGVKVKEEHQFAFVAGPNGNKAVGASQDELASDYLAPGNDSRGDGRPRTAYRPYGEGFYGYPAYGYGYPYAWGYPYPYYGLGFGYYGGFGGFRGGFRGRFR